MNQGLSKILKIILIASAVLLAVLFVFGIVLIIGWPWWVGFFVLIGLLGLCLALIFLKKIWIRRSEEQFVHQVIEQDNSHMSGLGDKEKEASKELQDRWKEAIDALKASHLKKQGNPLYVLPWYMVIGESGTGKTTAIQSARLSSPFTEISRISGISGTRNCDWWFFEQAIILDTAGRYAIPVDEGRDKDEWEKFLAQLIKFRKKEPINGLVVTVGADKLLQAGSEILEDDGRNIRRRIDELMRVLGAKFPVYVLVTKCDLIQGMTQFCDHLPEKAHDQAMGVMNHELSKDIATFLDRSIFSMGERLRDLRLLLFHRKASRGADKGIDPSLLLFPEEFERLKPGMFAFIKGAFQENPYQESPILRGIFYSSGRQEGRPFSHFLKALGLIDDGEALPGTNKGLFLHDLFSRILPGDRRLFVPTQRSLHWNRLTKNMGLTSWVAIIIALCGLLSFSFVKNLRTLRLVSNEFKTPPVLQGEILSDASIMDRFRQAILEVEDHNRSWWVPRFGLNESINVESRLKERYCKQFKDGFLVSFDKQMAGRVARFSMLTSKKDMGAHVPHLVRRINILRARLEGEDFEMLRSRPQASYGPLVLVADRRLIPEIRNLFEDMYLCYLAWSRDSSSLNQEMNDLQKYLKHVLSLEGANFQWLVIWANQDPSLSALTLRDFWGGSGSGPDEAIVPAAFTPAGNEQIDSFVKEMESALTDPLIITTKKMDFQRWYKKAYVNAWYNFGSLFPQGSEGLKIREEWQQAASRTGTEKGPYISLLDRMAVELEPFATGDDNPSWVKLVYEFKDAVAASKLVSLEGKGFMKKASSKGKKIISRFGKDTEGLREGEIVESRLVIAKALRTYLDALAEITQASSSRMAAYQIAREAYECEDPATDKSPFFRAQNAVNRFKTSVASAEASEEMFWNLVTGPLDFLLAFVSGETACHLQKLWEKEVLVEIQGVSSQQRANRILFGEDGYAVKFIKGSAAPFVGRDRNRGYYAKKILGRHVPFSDEFLGFVTKGAKIKSGVYRDSYAVSITGLPTDTKFRSSYEGPRLGVESSSIELQCANETRTLVNYNYPVKKTFNWSPNNCSDLVFTINVGNLVLTKKYTGFYAFPRFLNDFSKGQRVFYPAGFPDDEAALKRMGIRYIKVKYRFSRHEPVLSLLRNTPGRAPEDIVECRE